MCKKARCVCKVDVLQYKPIAFLAVLVSVAIFIAKLSFVVIQTFCYHSNFIKFTLILVIKHL